MFTSMHDPTDSTIDPNGPTLVTVGSGTSQHKTMSNNAHQWTVPDRSPGANNVVRITRYVLASPGQRRGARRSCDSSTQAQLSPYAQRMADLIVEIHVPLTPTPGTADGGYAYPWIDDIEQYLEELDGSDGEQYDGGEELGDEYLFFLASAPEARLVELATKVAKLPGVPPGVYVTINDSDGDMGDGRRIDLHL